MYILSLSYPHFPFLKNSSTLAVSVTHLLYPHPNPRNKSKLFDNELPVEHWTLGHWQCQLPIACLHPKTRNKSKLFKNELSSGTKQVKTRNSTAVRSVFVETGPGSIVANSRYWGWGLSWVLFASWFLPSPPSNNLRIHQHQQVKLCFFFRNIYLRSLTPRYPLWRCWSWSVHEVSNMLLCVTKITMWVENCVTMWI